VSSLVKISTAPRKLKRHTAGQDNRPVCGSVRKDIAAWQLDVDDANCRRCKATLARAAKKGAEA
jgi:hypothetical protein